MSLISEKFISSVINVFDDLRTSSSILDSEGWSIQTSVGIPHATHTYSSLRWRKLLFNNRLGCSMPRLPARIIIVPNLSRLHSLHARGK